MQKYPISDLFEDFYGIRISPATIKKAENECFNNLEHFEEAVMKQLLHPILFIVMKQE